MFGVGVRPRLRVKAAVCALVASGALFFGLDREPRAAARSAPRPAPSAPAPRRESPPPPRLPVGPVSLEDPDVMVYPPSRADTPRPVAVMLHGMCDEPEYECPSFAGSTTDAGWLVCPRANLRCNGGGSIWSGDARFFDSIEAGVERVESEWSESVDAKAGRTLIGFSLGAIRGMDLAHRGDGKYRQVILIGAKIYPNAEKLRKAGVQRIVLVAGENDMMKWHMVGQAKKLVRAGFPAAFMSLGKIGHAFPRDMNARMRRAVAWARGDDSAFVPSERGELAWKPADG